MRIGPQSFAAILVGALCGCHRPSVEASGGGQDAGNETLPLGDGARAPHDALLSARCRPVGAGFALGDPGADVEIGDAVETPNGYFAISIVHATVRGPMAAIARIPRPNVGSVPPAGPVSIVDLGPVVGDAPPPRLAWRGTELVAAAYAPTGVPSRRDLTLYENAPDTGGRVVATIAQQRDDSFAFDLAFAGHTGTSHGANSGVVVWDEATPARRGVIRAASVLAIAADASTAAAHDISPSESDAEVPRIVTDGAGFRAFWIARRPDAAESGDAAGAEATSEGRSFGWIETVSLDEHGVAVGPTKLVTPDSGRVSAYDVAALPGPEKGWIVVVRDDGEVVDGSAGALLRVHVSGLGEPTGAPARLTTGDLGRGAPVLVEGTSLFLSWVARGGETRLLPLDSEGSPAAPPSAEDGMSDDLPLRSLATDHGVPAAARLLVAMASIDPKDAGSEPGLRYFACDAVAAARLP